MKKYFIIALVSLVFLPSIYAQGNLALQLDGIDNKLSIGQDTLKDYWTLEAWIKGDGNEWKELEPIISGGDYGDLNTVDYFPLTIKNGKLHNEGANISSLNKLSNNEWIHIAATSDGSSTVIYINGEEAARRDSSTSILPSAIGIDQDGKAIFGGLIDEVRIWSNSLSSEQIKQWMYCAVTPEHPQFEELKGYYPFDDIKEGVAVNRVGRGHQSYHLRSGRFDYYGDKPLAVAVVNDNILFENYNQKQKLFNATVIASEWDSDQGEKDEQILKVRIIVDGDKDPLELSSIELDLSECSNLDDIESLNLYYTGSSPRTTIREKLCETKTKLKKDLKLKIDGKFALKSGVNYFLLTADIASNATLGNVVKITVPNVVLSKSKITPIPDIEALDKQIYVNSKTNSDIFRIIQWNIWHGGVHVKDGQIRVAELIKDSNADIVMMQESYGIQQFLKKTLGFNMLTASDSDNLSLLSRFPLENLETKKAFYSNPAYVTLPMGKEVLLNNCWLRYSYKPEYTCDYGMTGLDTDVWVAEDSTRPLFDIEENFKNDITPYIKDGMDVIVGGDFNSGSHLDWTERAAHHHFGYVADLPVSKYMLDKGYTDTFRALNPDEVVRPEGTFAVIFGHLQNSRIDFIYYKGAGIRPIFSKIVRTTYEIDDVWTGDHAAVLTTFEVVK